MNSIGTSHVKGCFRFMGKQLGYYFYYIYFNAYWTSFDVGEKTIPRQNAIYYMFLLQLFFINGISFTLVTLGEVKYPVPILLVEVLTILLINHFALSKAKFNKLNGHFEFISKKPKRSRLKLFWGIIIMAGLINVFGVLFFALQSKV